MQYLQYLQMDEVKLNRSGRNFKKWKWNYAIRITHYHATIINLSTYRECTQDKLNMRLHGQLKYGLAVSFTQTHSAHFIPYVHLKTYSLKTQSAVKIYHATHYLNIFCKTLTHCFPIDTMDDPRFVGTRTSKSHHLLPRFSILYFGPANWTLVKCLTVRRIPIALSIPFHSN